jgi:putative flippase GtrA
MRPRLLVALAVQRPRSAARICYSEAVFRQTLHYTSFRGALGSPTDTGPSDWRTPINAIAEHTAEDDEGALRCYRHPNNPTRLRCNRCERPICTQCAIPTSVGLRCPECARGPVPVMYQADTAIVARAIVGGFGVAIVIGIAWGLLNTLGLGLRPAYDWGFWFSLLLGFGVAEAVSFLAKRRRGPTLQAIGIACVLLGFAISRVVIGVRLLGAFDTARLPNLLQGVQPPTLLVTALFVGLACLIAWRRFQ